MSPLTTPFCVSSRGWRSAPRDLGMNDKARMTNVETMTKHEFRSHFERSCPIFVIRHSSFVIFCEVPRRLRGSG
jgi:hypothetical protein